MYVVMHQYYLKGKMKIDGHLDLFSGIGGFSLGLKQAGIEPRWLGFSDIDKYANKLFKRRFPNAKELGSVTDVSYKSLKGQRIDLLTGGFPCQAFSIAGKRKGFDDTRGTLFFEIQRILEDYIRNGKPISCILLENVKGLLNHDNHRTFATIYGILCNLNYTIECQLINTKWWLPQSRERIYIFGRYNGNPSGRKIFPIYNNSKKVNDLQGQYTNTLTARYTGIGNGSYVVESEQYAQKIKRIGGLYNQSTRWGVYDTNGISPTLTQAMGNGGGHIPMINKSRIRRLTEARTDEAKKIRKENMKNGKDYSPRRMKKLVKRKDNVSNTITSTQSKEQYVQIKYNNKQLDETLEQNDFKKNDVKALDLYNRKAQDNCPPLTDANHMPRLYDKSRIRRLTPVECERLQGFPDGWTDGQSDTQRYKQCVFFIIYFPKYCFCYWYTNCVTTLFVSLGV